MTESEKNKRNISNLNPATHAKYAAQFSHVWLCAA